MEKVDILIQSLEPEIDAKCAQIRQKKSEGLLAKVFVAVALLMLIVPTVFIFLGVSIFAVLIPIVFVGAVFLAALPIFMSKGVEIYEQI